MKWYIRHPIEAFTPNKKKNPPETLIVRIWIVTGWCWASWLLQRGIGRGASKL